MKKLFLSLLLISSALISANLKVGDTIKPFYLINQFDEAVSVNSFEYNTLVISSEKDLSSHVNDFLQKQKKNFLEDHKALYISDIHAMPSIITSMLALPKMKKYPYEILLIYEEGENMFPVKEGYLTIVKMKENKITSITFENDLNKVFQ